MCSFAILDRQGQQTMRYCRPKQQFRHFQKAVFITCYAKRSQIALTTINLQPLVGVSHRHTLLCTTAWQNTKKIKHTHTGENTENMLYHVDLCNTTTRGAQKTWANCQNKCGKKSKTTRSAGESTHKKSPHTTSRLRPRHDTRRSDRLRT